MKRRTKWIMAACILVVILASVLVFAGVPPYEVVDISATTNCVAITASSAQYSISYPGYWYVIQATDNDAYLLSGTDPTAAATAGNFGWIAGDHAPVMMRIKGPKVAVIGKAAGGFVCFLRQKNTGPL